MEFTRRIYTDLLKWKQKEQRKPLLIMGARQIGKTTILKSFGHKEYSQLIYLNFEKQQDIHAFFEGNKEPKKILQRLSLLAGKDVEESNTLIVMDEIQECRDAVIALKYFAEELPNIQIIGAGSLLGLSIGNKSSFPVGKVEFLYMYPLSFEEYLQSAKPQLLATYLHFLDEPMDPIPDAFFEPLMEVHKEYILFGGMPEVAVTYLQTRDISLVQNIQDNILQAYALDFVKHADQARSTKIQQVWNSLPSQLAKTNKKFIYKLIKSGARAREYEDAIQWLIQAGLVYKIPKINTPSIPLKAYEDVSSYKLYVFETGLLIRLAGLDPKTFIDGHMFFKEFKGSLAENYVCQTLQAHCTNKAYFWESNGKAEVDFLVEHKGNVIPIEVKSGRETKAKSLTQYKIKHQPKLRMRISELNLKLSDDLLNLPLFYASRVQYWIDQNLEE